MGKASKVKKVLSAGQRVRTAPLTVLGFSQNPTLNNHSRYADDVGQTHAGSLIADSVSETPMCPP